MKRNSKSWYVRISDAEGRGGIAKVRVDSVPVDKEFFEMIVSSNLRYLHFQRVSNKTFSLDPSYIEEVFISGLSIWVGGEFEIIAGSGWITAGISLNSRHLQL